MGFDYSNCGFYWMIHEENGRETSRYLEFVNSPKDEEFSNYAIRYRKAYGLEIHYGYRAKDIGTMIDRDLENGNYHSCVGFGEYLADILVEEVGDEKATQILEKMVRDRGSLLVIEY